MLKKVVCISLPAFFVFLVTFQFSFSSCAKKDTIIDTVIKVRVDTFQKKDTPLTVGILTANSWKFQEFRALVGSNYIFYVRGGSNNTQNFDNEYITFNSNNTGTYTDNTGFAASLTWNFTDATNKKLVWIWNLPTPVTVTWENIVYDNGAIRYTEYFTQSGVTELSSAVRIPK